MSVIDDFDGGPNPYPGFFFEIKYMEYNNFIKAFIWGHSAVNILVIKKPTKLEEQTTDWQSVIGTVPNKDSESLFGKKSEYLFGIVPVTDFQSAVYSKYNDMVHQMRHLHLETLNLQILK